jgi:hypothetical protein
VSAVQGADVGWYKSDRGTDCATTNGTNCASGTEGAGTKGASAVAGKLVGIGVAGGGGIKAITAKCKN